MKILSMNAAVAGLLWCTLLGASTAGSAQTSLSLAEAQDKALDQAYAMERALIDVEVAKRGRQGIARHRVAASDGKRGLQPLHRHPHPSGACVVV